MTAWWTGPLAGFDIESTGTNVEADRIVTWAYAIQHDPAERPEVWGALIDPGVEIPKTASDIHGVTTELAREKGEQPKEAVWRALRSVLSNTKAPLVIYNAPFDVTLLDREARRHGFGALDFGRPFIDPLVIDKAMDPYRKGSRKLADVCAHYGITLADAHDAQNDVLAAMKLARALGERFPEVGDMCLAELQQYQAAKKAEQAASFQKYKRANGEPGIVIDPSWPMVRWADRADAESPDRRFLTDYRLAKADVLAAAHRANETDPDPADGLDETDAALVRTAHALLAAARALPGHLRPAGGAS